MMVTTGGRGTMSACSTCSWTSSISTPSASRSSARIALWPSSSTTMVAVSRSSAWLMVTIIPCLKSSRMTSDALTDIRLASSPTEMTSGISTSRTTGAVGF
jgi:hypothetical protein